MNGFIWASGHLGWGIFALLVFTGLWFLLTDLYWRLTKIKTARLLMTMTAGWVIGVGLILLTFYAGNR